MHRFRRSIKTGLWEAGQTLSSWCSWVQAPGIMFQVFRAIEQRISRIHNLDDHVAPLQHPPQLAPHLKVFLKRRDDQTLL